MNSVEKELRGYINGTEAMSGFDSYDSYEGEYGYFDDADGDYDYMDGDAWDYASGPMNQNPATTVADPYVIQYVNGTGASITATLFGYNDYFSTANFNNGALVVTNLQTGTLAGYSRLVAQSNNKFFKI